MEISVIIPTYKPGEYIWRCLDSFCAQSMPKESFEIIVVLNGCKNPYDAALREYFSSHSDLNWYYIQTDTPGVSNARNLALDSCRGEYVAFVDDDDFVSPSYLEELFAHSSADTIALCYPYAFHDGFPEKQLSYEITDAYERYSGRGRIKALSIRKYFSGPCMKMIPIAYISDRRFDIRFKNGEDSLFMFLISDRMEWVDFTSKQAVYYRRFRANSAVTSKQSVGDIIKNCRARIRAYTSIYFSNPSRYSFRRYSMYLLGTVHIMVSRLLTGKI